MTLEQPQTEPIFLQGHEPFSKTTLHGWPAILFGLLLLVAGLPIVALGMGWIHYLQNSIHAPLWVVGISGGLFMTGGLWLVVHGLRGLRHIWKTEHGKRQLPTSPWLWDYPWQAQGTTDNNLKSALGCLIAFMVFGIFLSPFHWVAFIWKDSSFFWQSLVGLLDLVVVVGVGSRFFTKLKQYLSFGNPSLSFHSFPFFLGHTMSLTLQRVPPDVQTLQFDLRYIEEVYELQGSEEDKKSVVACYQIYKDSQTIDSMILPTGGDLHLSWELPDNKALSSLLSERPTKFWELEVTAERPDVNYRSRFLLPIYAQNP